MHTSSLVLTLMFNVFTPPHIMTLLTLILFLPSVKVTLHNTCIAFKIIIYIFVDGIFPFLLNWLIKLK